MNNDHESAVYCATQCAAIGKRQSTWTYWLGGVEYEITATWNGSAVDVSDPTLFN